MTPEGRAWLAGILEGEGCFGSSRSQGGTVDARVSLEMTDEDVVRDAAALMGTVARPKAPRRDAPTHWKPQYAARVSGRRAIDLMAELLPHLRTRRTERVCQVIGDYHESRMFVCQPCGAEFYAERRGGRPPVACGPTCQQEHTRQYMAAWKAARKDAA